MGKAFTKALLKEGATVYAVARRVDAMQELKALGAHTLKWILPIRTISTKL